jgi:transcriptional regulator with XRE-family HTH domain
MTIEEIAGENIRRIRQKKGLSQEALALDARMSRPYIGEVERAEKTISIDRLQKIAKVLEVDVWLLLQPHSSIRNS